MEAVESRPVDLNGSVDLNRSVARSAGLEIVRIGEVRAWNSLLTALPSAHILQSFQWGEIKARYGWSPHRLAFLEEGVPIAAASVLVRPTPYLPLSVLYSPKGPILDYRHTGRLEKVLQSLEDFARSQRGIFIKIDPDVPANDQATIKLLEQRNWRYSQEQIQFRNSLVIDLRQGEGDLLRQMKPKTRYNIRLGLRRGIVIVDGTPADLVAFYQMFLETSQRDGFVIRPFQYYMDTWRILLESNLANLILAYYGGRLLAGLMVVRFDTRAWYMYGASREMHRDLMPNHVLQWEAMCWAKSQGCHTYDMWGAPEKLDPSDPLWGVYRFKEGFGGDFVSHIGAWDFAARSLLHRVYSSLAPAYVQLLQRMYKPDVLRSTGGGMGI
ncbi:MAG: peptidoglycan bridge formation glycyltransferase FemA/FemB family protein [Chloroflexi bacterium]|nr:peptidoglycan bridge formation glycyltransferase FemA/FemB family protein [Chloroflexota bacterium]